MLFAKIEIEVKTKEEGKEDDYLFWVVRLISTTHNTVKCIWERPYLKSEMDKVPAANDFLEMISSQTDLIYGDESL